MAWWPPKQRQTNTESVSTQLNLIVFSDKIILYWFNTIEINHNNIEKNIAHFGLVTVNQHFGVVCLKKNMNLYRACCFWCHVLSVLGNMGGVGWGGVGWGGWYRSSILLHTRHATLLHGPLALPQTRHATLLHVPLALAYTRHATLGWGDKVINPRLWEYIYQFVYRHNQKD